MFGRQLCFLYQGKYKKKLFFYSHGLRIWLRPFCPLHIRLCCVLQRSEVSAVSIIKTSPGWCEQCRIWDIILCDWLIDWLSLLITHSLFASFIIFSFFSRVNICPLPLLHARVKALVFGTDNHYSALWIKPTDAPLPGAGWNILLLVANGHQICIKCTKADVRLRTPDDGQKGCPKHVQS